MSNYCAEGIWFRDIIGTTVYYAIRGDSEKCSAAFDDVDAVDAFRIWSSRYVSLSKELDDFAYFYVPKGEKQPYSDILAIPRCGEPDMSLNDDWSEEQLDDMISGIPPDGWRRLGARTAMKYLTYEYQN